MTLSMQVTLAPADNLRLANLCGEMDDNINHIARALSVKIKRRGGCFQLNGDAAELAATTLKTLYQQADQPFDANAVRLYLGQQLTPTPAASNPVADVTKNAADVAAKTASLHLRNAAQLAFWEKISAHAIILCSGPAGTGKTYVALAAALRLLHDEPNIRRLVLTRPVVEAGGERLGFLPGDMEQKVNPYLRPMHDVLHQLLGRREMELRMARGEIDVIPLAFMRGLTLSNAVVVLDEAQNTLPVQIKMLLTRLGEDAKIIVLGDETQSDIPDAAICGLTDAAARLKGVAGIAHHRFSEKDIVRHPLVKKILRAYE